jgi:hypothetical protein
MRRLACAFKAAASRRTPQPDLGVRILAGAVLSYPTAPVRNEGRLPLPEVVTWTGSEDSESYRYHDARTGFSVSVPGHPVLVDFPPSPSEPAYDARLDLADLPVSVRIRLDSTTFPVEAEGWVNGFLRAFGRNRSGSQPRVVPARPDQIAAWGVDAAASALYGLARADPAGPDTEQVLAFARGQELVVVTQRFASAGMDSVQWALFHTAMAGTIRWDPADSPDQVPDIWPPSPFLAPGVIPVLIPACLAVVASWSARIQPDWGDLATLARRLHGLIVAGDPPALAVTDEMRATYAMYLCDTVANPDLAAAIEEMLGMVRIAHDLRGFALIWLNAIRRSGAAE